jgi:uncharacterized protein
VNATAQEAYLGRDGLEDIVDQVGHLLPGQAPIRRFVHHNTLHAFEEKNFEEAVVEAGKLFNCEPFPTESFFRDRWAEGRIRSTDVEMVLPEDAETLSFGGWTRREFQLFRLKNLFPIPTWAEVRYALSEGTLLDKFLDDVPDESKASFAAGTPEGVSLRELWMSLSRVTPPLQCGESPHYKKLLEKTVHPLLIRFCGAYLDQGISYWPMLKGSGFYATFVSLFGQSSGPQEPWMDRLCKSLKVQRRENWDSEKALKDGLQRLNISEDRWSQACLERGLALAGWAGMVRQLEERPDRAPVEAPPCRLIDYLAVYLQLEAHAVETEGCPERKTFPSNKENLSLIYEAFVVAQRAGMGPSTLADEAVCGAFLKELSRFDELQRRRLTFLAYEHHYVVSVLDALEGHQQQGEYRRKVAPRFQAVFCIDDREESLRRHLEELAPEVETLGYAGFFNVPMNYQSLDDVHSLPLCPVNIQPKHLVREVSVDDSRARQRAKKMKKVGFWTQTFRANRTTMSGGLFLSSLAGFLSGVPLVGKTLFPGLFRTLEHAFVDRVVGKVATRLAIEREAGSEPDESGLWPGFTIPEMTNIVKGALETMGPEGLAPLFLVVGHGSSSLNNPHEAAHDCGATGGGRGGPNARAFSAMANHPKVRDRLATMGFKIPQTTWFVGAYHNTCDDTVEFYDTDLIPPGLEAEFAHASTLLRQACVLDAHERCRRFENVPLDWSPQKAFQHVLARSEELAQPRPEYGHCTNSICLVGRRDRTRGVFLDRRAFLVSYNPLEDPKGDILGRLLESVGPVGAGINLEYYFSAVDKSGYGCGTKLPHNVTGLLGIMDGHASDLRTGLPWQMVEIHEPMRLVNVVEAEPDILLKILAEKKGLRALVDRRWIRLVAQSPTGQGFWIYSNGKFERYKAHNAWIETVNNSAEHYGGKRQHLPCAQVRAGLKEAR